MHRRKKLLWITIKSHGPTYGIRHEKSRAAPTGGEITITSYPACNNTSFIRKRCITNEKLILNAMKKSMIDLSESVLKKCVQRLLAKKSRWRHIRLAIKPRYHGNHGSQIKCYYWALSWCLGRLAIYIKKTAIIIFLNLSGYKCC